MLRNLTLTEYLKKVKAKEISPDEVLTEINQAIDQVNPKLNIV